MPPPVPAAASSPGGGSDRQRLLPHVTGERLPRPWLGLPRAAAAPAPGEEGRELLLHGEEGQPPIPPGGGGIPGRLPPLPALGLTRGAAAPHLLLPGRAGLGPPGPGLPPPALPQQPRSPLEAHSPRLPQLRLHPARHRPVSAALPAEGRGAAAAAAGKGRGCRGCQGRAALLAWPPPGREGRGTRGHSPSAVAPPFPCARRGGEGTGRASLGGSGRWRTPGWRGPAPALPRAVGEAPLGPAGERARMAGDSRDVSLSGPAGVLEREAPSPSGELCPGLTSGQERQGAMGKGPAEATKNDEGSETSSLWGETVGARPVPVSRDLINAHKYPKGRCQQQDEE